MPSIDDVPDLAGMNKVEITKHPFQAQRPRSFFATTVSRLGVSDRLVKAYKGHTAQDVLGEHYLKIGLDDLKVVSDAMNGWRRNSKVWSRSSKIDQKIG